MDELLVFFMGRSLVEPKRVVVRKVDFSLWPDTGRGMPGGAKAAGPAVCQADAALGLRPRRALSSGPQWEGR